MRKTASVLTALFLAVALCAGASQARALSSNDGPADFVREIARDSARVVHATNMTVDERRASLDHIARQRLDHNRLNRFFARTTGLDDENYPDLLGEAGDEAVRRVRRLLNDPAIARLYPSKVALLPNGRAMVETRIDYQDAPSRIWSWQLTRIEQANGAAAWGLLDIVADDRQSVALSARQALRSRLAEVSGAQGGGPSQTTEGAGASPDAFDQQRSAAGDRIAARTLADDAPAMPTPEPTAAALQ